MDPDEADFWETVEEARSAGTEDAVWNIQSELLGYALRNTSGTRTWEE